MAETSVAAPTTEELTTEHLVAGADRRFYAFVIDTLAAWGVVAAGAYAAYALLIEPGDLGGGIAAVAGTVLLVGLVGALLVGIVGLTRRERPADRRTAGRAARARPRRGHAPDARVRRRRARVDRAGRPQRVVARLARPPGRLGGRRRPAGARRRRAGGRGPPPGRQPHRDAAGARLTDPTPAGPLARAAADGAVTRGRAGAPADPWWARRRRRRSPPRPRSPSAGRGRWRRRRVWSPRP